MIVHPLEPIFDAHSKILILGTMPSPQSRTHGFYYAHPQNRFWPVLSQLFAQEIPSDPVGRTGFLLAHGIALWDVLRSCEIKNADDGSIRNPVANDLSLIFDCADIRAVFTTGRKATVLYEQHCRNGSGAPPPQYLPSTSPANCRYTVEVLTAYYRSILPYIGLSL